MVDDPESKFEKKSTERIAGFSREVARFFDAIPEMITIQDKEYRVVYQNRAHREAIGDQVGNFCYEVYEHQGSVCPGCPAVDSVKYGKITFAVRPGYTREGKKGFFEVSSSPYFDENGDLLYFIKSIRDITLQKELEDARGKSEERLAEAQRIAHMGNWDLDLETRELFWSDELYRIFGLKPGAFKPTYEAFLERVHPDDRDFVDTFFKQKVKQDFIFSIDHRILLPEGSERIVHEDAEVILGAEGEILRIIGIAQDITERRLTEKSSWIMGRAIATTMNAVAFADLEGRLTYVNKSFLSMWGYSDEEEVLGLKAVDFWRDPAIAEEIIAVLGNNKSWSGEMIALKKDGSPFYVQLSANLVQDDAGKPLCMMSSFIDVTERKQAVKEIENLHRKNEAVLASVGEGILGMDMKGITTFVNLAATRMTGWKAEELIGRFQHNIIHHTTVDGTPCLLENCTINSVAMTGKTYYVDTDVFWRKDGTSFPVEYTCTPLWEDRKLSGAVVVFKDITERKKAEDERIRLESIAEAVNTMNNIGYAFAGIRHEIGNPINAIKISLSVLKRNLDDMPKAEIGEYIDRVMESVGRVEYLLRSMKNYNMYESPEMKSFDVKGFMNDMIRLVKEDFGSRGIGIDIDIRPGVGNVYADPRALQQIMLNILANASDALNAVRNPVINVTVTEHAGHALIEVSDNGCGMAEEQLRNLFKPFVTSKPGGTGLGLVIARKMLARMGGEISITSRENAGTHVRLTIPVGRT